MAEESQTRRSFMGGAVDPQRLLDELLGDLERDGRLDTILTRKMNRLERELRSQMQRELQQLLEQALVQLVGGLGGGLGSGLSPVNLLGEEGPSALMAAGDGGSSSLSQPGRLGDAASFRAVEDQLSGIVSTALEQAVIGQIRGQMRPGGLLDPQRQQESV